MRKRLEAVAPTLTVVALLLASSLLWNSDQVCSNALTIQGVSLDCGKRLFAGSAWRSFFFPAVDYNVADSVFPTGGTRWIETSLLSGDHGSLLDKQFDDSVYLSL